MPTPDMPLQTDFHQLDTCSCDFSEPILDCWTVHYNRAEREASRMHGVHFRSVWVCQRCGDYSDKEHGANMEDLDTDEVMDITLLDAPAGSMSAALEDKPHEPE